MSYITALIHNKTQVWNRLDVVNASRNESIQHWCYWKHWYIVSGTEETVSGTEVIEGIANGSDVTEGIVSGTEVTEGIASGTEVTEGIVSGTEETVSGTEIIEGIVSGTEETVSGTEVTETVVSGTPVFAAVLSWRAQFRSSYSSPASQANNGTSLI